MTSMWIVFAALVAISLVVDLVAHRGDHAGSRNQAIAWSVVWIGVAVAFGIWIAVRLGSDASQDFFSAYVMEKSLSIDNLFVFLVVFRQLRVPAAEQHRVLFWGILGALVARALFIGLGTAVLAQWHVVVYVLGAFLIYTGYKTIRQTGHDGAGGALAWLRRRLRVTEDFHGHRFVVREAGRLVATPLLLALLAIEVTDVMFAIDSVPAVLSISEDNFIVYSSNVFAILGLRALYMVIADLLERLKYLHYGLGAILVLAGAKMLGGSVVHVPHLASLIALVAVIGVTIIASVVASRRAVQLRPSP
jgi:tellurite resistance protein TerC